MACLISFARSALPKTYSSQYFYYRKLDSFTLGEQAAPSDCLIFSVFPQTKKGCSEKWLTSNASGNYKALYINGVVVDALNCYSRATEHAGQGVDERRTNDVADITLLDNPTGKYGSEILADAIDDVVDCGACCNTDT